MSRKSKEQLRKEETERLQGAIDLNKDNVSRDLRNYEYELGALLYQESTYIKRINELSWRISKLRKEQTCLNEIKPEEFSEKYFNHFHCAQTDWKSGIEFSKELLSDNVVLEYLGQKHGMSKLNVILEVLHR